MGLYRVCPNCGNTEENVGIYVCADCHLIFCDRCGNKDFDQFPLPFTTMHCPRCNSKEVNSNGLICNNDKGVSQIIRDDESVTIITDQGSCVTCDQRSYWLESENQRRFDEAVEEALHRDSQKSALPKGISQIIRDEESVTVITEQGTCVTCDQRSYWLESENQRRFDEAVEAALNRDNQKSALPKGISQIIRDEDSVTVITDQGSCVTCDQRSYWLESENQRRFDEAVEEALRRDSQKSVLKRDEFKNTHYPNAPIRKKTINDSPKSPTAIMYDSTTVRLQECKKRVEKYNTTGICIACGRTFPIAVLERGNGLCPLCQHIHERKR